MTKQSKVFITGANEAVGHYMVQEFEDAQYTDNRHIDLANRDHIRIQLAEYSPDIIIHCQEISSLDRCHKENEEALLKNAIATMRMSEYAKENAVIIYISSGSVFGEEGKMMPEEDHPDILPVNYYATTKLYGEWLLRNNKKKGQKIIVIRTSWVFGKKNNKFVEQVLPKIKDNETIYAVDDVRGMPTYAGDLARFVKAVVEHVDEFGDETVLHFTNQESASRFDLANKMKDILNSTSNIIPVKNQYFDAAFKRPSREYLGMDKTMAKIPFEYRDWEVALREYITNTK